MPPPGANATRGALLVYSWADDAARRVLDGAARVNADASAWVTVAGERVYSASPMRTGADGIALSADAETVFWTPLTSRQFFALPAAALRDAALSPSQLLAQVQLLGQRASAGDGLSFSSDGCLYMSNIESARVTRWRPAAAYSDADAETVAADAERMQWPDTFA